MEGRCYDPLDYWPSSIAECIFQHLTGNEILDATKVSKGWENFIAESTICWRNTVVTIKTSECIETMIRSDRRYSRFKIVNPSKNCAFDVISHPRRKLKSLEIYRAKFLSEQNLETILKHITPSIENLNLSYLEVSIPSEATLTKFNFPKLKTLKLAYHFSSSTPWINRMIANCPLMDTLIVSNGCDELMKNLVLSSTNLKHFSIAGIFQDFSFFKDLAMNMPSRLEVFEFNDILSSSQSDINLRYFNHFFKSQSQTLQRFQTDALLEADELETAFRMPNLHTLNIKSFHDPTSLYLESQRNIPLQLPAANLKVFHVHVMDQNLLELMALNARNLEEIRVDEFLAVDASDVTWFPKLRILHVFWLDSSIGQEIRSKNERSHLEQMILDGIQMIQIDFEISDENQDILTAIED